MSGRSLEVLRCVRKVLVMADGTPLDPALIAVKLDNILSPHATFSEINSALELMDAERMVSGATNIAGITRWAITDKGRLAEL
jgi:hypothetical protein